MIRHKRLMLVCASFLLCLAVWPGAWVIAGEEKEPFVLAVSGGEENIMVTVVASNAADLYAYDLVVGYDPLRLRFTGATTALPGFTVEPIQSRGKVRYAYTRTGSVPGHNGKLELASFQFQRIRGGKASVQLLNAKLVDSTLVMTEHQLKLQAAIRTDRDREPFADLTGHWAEDTILEAVELGFVSGYPDGTFRPDGMITREEFTVMLAQALLLSDGRDQAGGFADEADIGGWAAPWVQRAVNAGLVSGYDDHTFRPNLPVKRQELAVMLARVLGAVAAGNPLAVSAYADSSHLEPWAVEPVEAVVGAGIMQGTDGNLLAPLNSATRAEAVAMVLRLLAAKQ